MPFQGSRSREGRAAELTAEGQIPGEGALLRMHFPTLLAGELVSPCVEQLQGCSTLAAAFSLSRVQDSVYFQRFLVFKRLLTQVT